MKLSMEQAAKVIGKTKKTIYNHKDRNKFSYEQDNEGRTVIDVSELLRVYGSSPEITRRLEGIQKGTDESESVITPNYTGKKRSKREENRLADYKLQIVKLELELEKEQALKNKVEDEVEYFKSALEKAQETVQKVTLLLENKSDERKETDWKRTIKTLEHQLANQEAHRRKQAEQIRELKEIEKRRTEKAAKRRDEQKALAAERKKTVWQKLFGKGRGV